MTRPDTSIGPFPGLRSFEPEEDHLFFGREHRVDELLEKLASHRFIAVIGASGTGKSSLVKAGLIPSLRSGMMTSAGSNWRIAVCTPGADPIGNLATSLHVLVGEGEVIPDGSERDVLADVMRAAVLRRSSFGLVDAVQASSLQDHESLLVVVDQFEELFRFRDKQERGESRDMAAAFVKLLLTAADRASARIYVVITMRSEFLAHCMEFPGLPRAINDGQYLVPRMSRDELREAIAGPVRVAGARLSDRLVRRVLNDAGREDSQLPVVQHAFMRVWRYWTDVSSGTGEAVDLNHYEQLGGLDRALSDHVDEVYRSLSPSQQRVAESIFRALTIKVPGSPAVRNEMRRSDLTALSGADGAVVDEVIDEFRREGRSFVVTYTQQDDPHETVVDISHESLIHKWDRLRRWADQEADWAAHYRRLEDHAQRWQRGEAGLLQGPELDFGLSWRSEAEPTPEWAERYGTEFDLVIRLLDESKAAVEEVHKARERARARNVRRVTVAAFVLAVVAAFAGLQAVNASRMRSVADENAARATANAIRADSLAERIQAAFDSLAARDALVAVMTQRSDSISGLVRELRAASQADTTAGRYVFPFTGPPIDGEIVFTVPPDRREEPQLETLLQVSPVTLDYSIGCNSSGEAVATFRSPGWIVATANEGTVAPDVCFGSQGVPQFIQWDSLDVIGDGTGTRNSWAFEVRLGRSDGEQYFADLDNDDGMHYPNFALQVDPSPSPDGRYELLVTGQDEVSGAYVEGSGTLDTRGESSERSLVVRLIVDPFDRTAGYFYAFFTVSLGRAGADQP